MTLHIFLYWLAVILFVVAALPLNLNVRCEWLAAAAIVLTYVL